ncbi:hypothetical protein Cp4436_01448 [Clostridium perfringens]|uniref:hypothetical protein n=1 Tax=Clostridium perfringens TaxID=1502 RepID=UPI002441838A|nr:hypothetical protein [Clostridium perfringens]MDG6889415.1 hypothetical protein [Clostridium perfringens]
MRYDGKLFISAEYTKEQFINLNLSMESSEEFWEEAIIIFKDRIEGRYINIVKELICNETINVDGFVVMVLNCLLIETLLQFKNGWDKTKHGNKDSYSRFLNEEFNDIFPTLDSAKIFYSHIRCGLLHSAETKNGSVLNIGSYDVIERNKECISVNVDKFTRRMIDYFNSYIEKLRDKKNIKERECFLRKMSYICRN